MSSRDPRTGRFTVATTNAPESGEGRFPTETEMPVTIQGDDANQLAYDEVPRRGPAADDLAQGGQWPLLRPRHPVLVAADQEARTRHGDQAALLRDAARMSDVGGMAAHVLGIDHAPRPSRNQDAGQVMFHGDHNPLSPVRSQDIAPGRPVGRVRQVTDDEPTGTPHGDLRAAQRGQGRARNR